MAFFINIKDFLITQNLIIVLKNFKAIEEKKAYQKLDLKDSSFYS